jgi:hypothetical protein
MRFIALLAYFDLVFVSPDRRRSQLVPLLHWEEGLGEEVAAVLDSGDTSFPCPPPGGGEGTRPPAMREPAGGWA